MPNEILIDSSPSIAQVRFIAASGFLPDDDGTNFTIGTPDDVVITMAGITAGNGRQSAKADLGATRAEFYDVLAAFDFTGETPTGGLAVNLYWAPSTSATTGNGNVAGNSGNDADAPNGALGTITLDEFLLLCLPIGRLPVHDGGVVQNGYVGRFSPPTRYGQLIVVNNTGDSFENDNVEHHVVFNPVVYEVQD